jgi:lipid-binding SYLF domain-containing protein
MASSRLSIVILVSLALVLAAGCRSPKGTTPQEKRDYTEKMRSEALAELYKKHPEARSQIKNAPGYAVFSNVGSKIFMLATGSGFGVAVNNRTGKKTYMKMVEAGGGLGMGIKKYKAVYIFNEKSALDTFITKGWQVGGDADAGAKYGDKGATAAAAANTDQVIKAVTVYEFTDAGISVSAVATGTRYYPDAELN